MHQLQMWVAWFVLCVLTLTKFFWIQDFPLCVHMLSHVTRKTKSL